MAFYITGDCHSDFKKIQIFCKMQRTTLSDVIIILGDAGINYFLDKTDYKLKKNLSKLPITLLMVAGNHEERPYNIPTYTEKIWNEGVVYWEEEFPNLLFTKDGEIYNLNGKKAIALGGAYSVDKEFRQMAGLPWFADEQPSKQINVSNYE